MNINKGICAILGVFITLGATGTIADDGISQKHNHVTTLQPGYANTGDRKSDKTRYGPVLKVKPQGLHGTANGSTTLLPTIQKFKGIEPDEID
jgi:hypothetical protein